MPVIDFTSFELFFYGDGMIYHPRYKRIYNFCKEFENTVSKIDFGNEPKNIFYSPVTSKFKNDNTEEDSIVVDVQYNINFPKQLIRIHQKILTYKLEEENLKVLESIYKYNSTSTSILLLVKKSICEDRIGLASYCISIYSDFGVKIELQNKNGKLISEPEDLP